jgi:outer membrane protein
MKKIVCGLVLAVILMSSASVFAADGRIVFVDLDQLFNEYYKTELADAQLKELADDFTKDREALINKIDSLEEQFNQFRDDAQNPALSDDVREERQEKAEEILLDMRERQREVRRFDETHSKKLETQQRRMRRRIVNEIEETVQTYAMEQGFSAVLDTSGQSLNGVPNVVYFEENSDITEDVLALLNKGRGTGVPDQP